MISKSYFDFSNLKFTDQVFLFNKTEKHTGFILRNIENLNFLEYFKNNDVLILNKVDFDIIDLTTFDFDYLNKEYFDILDKIIKLKAIKYIILNFNYLNTDSGNIEKFNKLLSLYPNINLIIKFKPDTDSLKIKLFIKAMKSKRVFVYFDPVELYLNKKPYSIQYRILKNEIGLIKLSDIDDLNEPILFGYGALDLIDFCKRLYDNLYQNIVALDTNLFKVINNFSKEDKKNASLRMKHKYRFHYEFICEKIKGNSDCILEMEDVFLNQIKVIDAIFKLEK